MAAKRPRSTTTLLAHDLRETLGRLVRRLRAEPGPPIPQLAVRSAALEREGPASVSEPAAAHHMRPQSMAQDRRYEELEALAELDHPAPGSTRRPPRDRRADGRRA